MHSLIWLWYSLGITGLIASPLPQGADSEFKIGGNPLRHEQLNRAADTGGDAATVVPIEPQSPSTQQTTPSQQNLVPEQRSNHGNGPVDFYEKVTRDLALIGVAGLGTKVYLDHKNKPPKGGGGSPPEPPTQKPPVSQPPLDPPQSQPQQQKQSKVRTGKSAAIGFDLDDIVYHDGDEYGKNFQETLTAKEQKIWEKCVEEQGGKRLMSATGYSDVLHSLFRHCDNQIRLLRKMKRAKAVQEAVVSRSHNGNGAPPIIRGYPPPQLQTEPPPPEAVRVPSPTVEKKEPSVQDRAREIMEKAGQGFKDYVARGRTEGGSIMRGIPGRVRSLRSRIGPRAIVM